MTQTFRRFNVQAPADPDDFGGIHVVKAELSKLWPEAIIEYESPRAFFVNLPSDVTDVMVTYERRGKQALEDFLCVKGQNTTRRAKNSETMQRAAWIAACIIAALAILAKLGGCTEESIDAALRRESQETLTPSPYHYEREWRSINPPREDLECWAHFDGFVMPVVCVAKR